MKRKINKISQLTDHVWLVNENNKSDFKNLTKMRHLPSSVDKDEDLTSDSAL